MIRTFDFIMDRASDLDFFALLARHPSLAAAAQELGLSPPAVSRRLAQLETRLGARLMNRTTRRLSLTPEGERYLEEGKRILRDIESLEHSLGASRDVPRGLLRVNASFGFGRRLLGPAISDFVRHYPEMEIQLHLSDRPLNLVAHGLDLGIRFGEPPRCPHPGPAHRPQPAGPVRHPDLPGAAGPPPDAPGTAAARLHRDPGK